MSGITETGFDRPRLDVILSNLIDRLKMPSVLGSEAVLDGTTADGQTAGIVAEIADTLYQIAEDSYNVVDPNAAIGAALFRLGPLCGIEWNAGQKDRVMCKLHIKQGETVYAGAQIRDTVTGVLFETISDIGPSESDTANNFAEVVALEYGTAPALTTHAAEKATDQYGWIDVAFAVDSTGGTVSETNAQFRRRRANSVAKPAQGVVDGLYGALSDLSGIGDVKIFTNPKAHWADIKPGDGAIPPNSCIVIVRHQVIVASVDQVAQTIWLYQMPGCDFYAEEIGGTGNAIKTSIADVAGCPHPIAYYVSQPMSIDVRIEYKPLPGEGFDGEEDETALKDALASYVNEQLLPGDDVAFMDLAPVALNAVKGRSGAYSIKLEAIKICEHGGTPTAADIATPFWKHPALSRANVTLVDVTNT